MFKEQVLHDLYTFQLFNFKLQWPIIFSYYVIPTVFSFTLKIDTDDC